MSLPTGVTSCLCQTGLAPRTSGAWILMAETRSESPTSTSSAPPSFPPIVSGCFFEGWETGKGTIWKVPVEGGELVQVIADLSFNPARSEEHTSELQSHSFISYAVFCLKN